MSSKGPSRGGALDALRFLAAGFIVVFHFGDEAPVSLRALHDIFNRGYLATDFFLMLSGFVLASIYGESILCGRVSPGQFWIKRAARNYPAHLITLSGLIVMVLFASAIGHALNHPEQYAWSALPAQLLMMHGWGLAPDTWNAPTWSISALFVCYAAFPWLWPLFHELKRPRACIAISLGVLLGADLAAHAVVGQPLFNLPFQWGLLRAIPLFLVGLSLARLVQTADLARQASILALAGGAVLVGNVAAIGADLVSILAICAIIVGCGAMPAGRPWPGAAWSAKISFSLFFTHTLSGAAYADGFRPWIFRFHPDLTVQWVIWWGELLFAVLVAVVFHYLIDEPIQRRLRTLLFRRSPAPRLAPAPSG
jgi:peptidoglycan/LPS O-acetylase OafA/YrhL